MILKQSTLLYQSVRSLRKIGKIKYPLTAFERIPNKSIIIRATAFTTISISTIYIGSIVSGYELYRARLEKSKEKINKAQQSVSKRVKNIFGGQRMITDYEKVYFGILGANILVYFLHLTSAKFSKNFLCSISASRPALSQFTSIFSHTLFFHMAMNMYVLHSFVEPLVKNLGSEQFIALYISGGIFASWVSLTRKALLRSTIPSLGASGCVCAVISFYCMLYPKGLLCVPIIENIIPHTFYAESALKVILAFEALGFLFFQHKSIIDHSAHFGGLLFGLIYHKIGYENMQDFKREVLKNWILVKKNLGISK